MWFKDDSQVSGMTVEWYVVLVTDLENVGGRAGFMMKVRLFPEFEMLSGTFLWNCPLGN